MWLTELSLLNFKNYDELTAEFSPTVNVFYGHNGAGKTNLLDALHYLSLCKSYFNPVDSQQIKQGQEFFMIQGRFEKNAQSEVITCSLKKSQKKKFQRNKKDYSRLADHIGLFPLVMISPNDSSLITEGSEERRKFVDNVISQTNAAYLDLVISYNKILQNRNSLLKQSRNVRLDEELLEIYDSKLVDLGERIFEERRRFMDVFTELFNRHYSFLTEDAELASLDYESQLTGDSFSDLLNKSLEKELLLERTTTGIHKDDLLFSVHDMPLKKFGSQGQQKSFVIALKLAQYTFLTQKKGFKPLLLLDDIFDKIDILRIRRLMMMISEDEFGQIFITHTNKERIEELFEGISTDLRTFEIVKGEIKKVDKV